MNKAEYLKIALKIIPKEIIKIYDLLIKQCDGYIYVIIGKVMYGLVQAVVIAYDTLKDSVKPYGYAPAKITQGI